MEMISNNTNSSEPVIYTVGYQALTPAGLSEVLRKYKVDRLIDVRTSPWSRKPGFGRKELEITFNSLSGPFYEWRGDTLGGKGDAIADEAIDWLATQPGRLALMCMEDDPCGCHRFWLVARRLLARGIECVHIHGEMEYSTAALLERCGETPPWQRQQHFNF